MASTLPLRQSPSLFAFPSLRSLSSRCRSPYVSLRSRSLSGSAVAQVAGKAKNIKKIVLEKPDQFRPPSHPARLRRPKPPRSYPGAPLTEEQKTRRYPNMFPREGTVTYKFLTDKWLHVFITVSILLSITGYVSYKDFATTTEYWHLVPSRSLFPWHPWQWLSQFVHVYKLHVERRSELTGEKRKKQLEEGAKRADFRRHHGLNPDGVERVGAFAGTMVWTGDGGKMGEGYKGPLKEGEAGEEGEREPRTKPKPRKWFGIYWS